MSRNPSFSVHSPREGFLTPFGMATEDFSADRKIPAAVTTVIIADQFGPVVNASVTKVLCSSSCALAEPVAGLALAERFTERTGIP